MESNQENQQPSERYQKIQEFSERRAMVVAVIEVLKAKRRFLMLTLFLALSGTLLGHYFQETTYTASSTLFVQALEDPTAAEYLLNQQIGRTDKAERVDTYIRFLGSDAFFMTVAQKLRYHEAYAALDLSTPHSQSALSFGLWKQKVTSLFTGAPVQQTVPSVKNASELAAVLKQLTAYETDYSHYIHIKTTSHDPATSKIIANVIGEEFVALTNDRGIQEIEQIKDFVKGKIQETEERLKVTEQSLIEFKKKNNVISTDGATANLAKRYTDITSDLEAYKMQLEENQKLISFFEKGQQAAGETNTQTVNPDGTRAYGAKETAMILYRKVEQLKRQKAVVQAQDDKTQEWRLRELDQEIDKTSQAFQAYVKKAGDKNIFLFMNPQKILQKINELKEENEVIKTKIATHQKLQDQMQSQIETIPSLSQKQLVLENTLRVDTENYTNLKNKLTELEIQKISQKKEIRIDQSAQMPGPSAKGNVLLKLLFSTLVSILLGISIIVGIESIDPSIKHRSDLSDCGIEFIGEVPLLSFTQPKGLKKTFGDTSQLIAYNNPESLEAMSFKYIRARLESYRYKFKKDHLIVSISSGAMDDGKSLIAANLSTTLAQLNRSVLLVDCDLRRPSQNAYFDSNPSYGLVDLLNMTQTLDSVLIKELRPKLDYIPAGFCHKNSTEYISSEKFRVLLNYLKDQYEYIIIDTPPVFAAVDAALIANYSDIPILIANFRETKKYNLSEAYNQILQISYKRVYGIINKAILSSARFHYYGYHNTPTLHEGENPTASATPKEGAAEIDQFLKNIKKKTS